MGSNGMMLPAEQSTFLYMDGPCGISTVTKISLPLIPQDCINLGSSSLERKGSHLK